MVQIVTGGSTAVDNTTIEYNAQNQLTTIARHWALIEAGDLTLSNGGSEQIGGTLDGKKIYMLVVQGTNENDTTGSISLRINNDSGSNYTRTRITGTTIDESASQTAIQIFPDEKDCSQTAIIYINGEANKKVVNIINAGENSSNAFQKCLGGKHSNTNAITRLDIIQVGGTTRSFAGSYALYYLAEVE